MLAAFWEMFLFALRPNFGASKHERGLAITFELITSLIKILVALTVVWAVAAGFLQTGRLIAYFPAGFPSKEASAFWPSWIGWAAVIVGVPVYAAKALGATLLIGLAAALVGGFLGFLFGVPRRISEASAPVPQSGGAGGGGAGAGAGGANRPAEGAGVPTPGASAATAAATAHAERGWESSTNLTQVSDWLTKIIVGVGLVEAKSIFERMAALSNWLGGLLFDGAAGSRLVIPAVIVAGLIIGFLYAYLFTQLFVAGLMVQADRTLATDDEEQMAAAVATISSVPSASAVIAPPMAGDQSHEPLPQLDRPTEAQRRAADIVGALNLADITDPQQLLAWSRSLALKDLYTDAAEGYRRLLTRLRTPEVLAEAARVFNAADKPDEARQMLSEALPGRGDVSPEARARMSFDAASVALYENPPEGYTKALQLLDAATLATDPRGLLHVLHACALGQRYRHEQQLSEAEKQSLRDQALEDLRVALPRDPGNLTWVRYLWDPSASGKAPVGSPNRDDDLEPFFDNPNFRALLMPPAAPAAPADPAPEGAAPPEPH